MDDCKELSPSVARSNRVETSSSYWIMTPFDLSASNFLAMGVLDIPMDGPLLWKGNSSAKSNSTDELGLCKSDNDQGYQTNLGHF